MTFSQNQKRKWGKRLGWRCELCGRSYNEGYLLEFHHIIPTSAGGNDTWDNAQLLCLFCHADAHILLEERGIGYPSANIVLARLVRTRGRRRK